MAFRRKPPVERLDDDSWIVRLQTDEQEVLSHIMNQLDELVENAQTGSESALVDRLFPPAFTHHDAQHEFHRPVNLPKNQRGCQYDFLGIYSCQLWQLLCF